MKKISFLFFILLAPILASAHVKWFAKTSFEELHYKITDTPVLFAGAIAIILLILGFYFDKKIKVPLWLKNTIERVAPEVLSMASIGFGISFLVFSINGFVFAPNLMVASENSWLLWVQGIAGVMMILGFYERIGGLILVVLFGIGIKYFGLVEMIDTLEMVGFALYAMIIGRPKWRIAESQLFSSLMHRFHEYGVSLLRIGTGLNLMILGFSEKIMTPGMAMNFLSEYHWNFMYNLGFEWFTDYWFAFSAGMTEFMIGLFLVLGIVTRLSVVFLAIFLLSTMILLGPIELMGHLPHFSIAIVLLVFGAGSRLHQK